MIEVVSIAPFDCPGCGRTIIIDQGRQINGSFVVVRALASDAHGSMVMLSPDRDLWVENRKLFHENALLRKELASRPWLRRIFRR